MLILFQWIILDFRLDRKCTINPSILQHRSQELVYATINLVFCIYLIINDSMSDDKIIKTQFKSLIQWVSSSLISNLEPCRGH